MSGESDARDDQGGAVPSNGEPVSSPGGGHTSCSLPPPPSSAMGGPGGLSTGTITPSVPEENSQHLDPDEDDDIIPLQIFVPELVLQKCFNVRREQLIWEIKQTILSSLPKELKESFNYGLYCPPVNGKSGKFLDEERPICDYPLMDPVAYLELRYKRRVYRMVNVDEKHIKQLHTRANLRRLLDNVGSANVEKVNKLCTRGLDPNFHDPDSGETPLTLAATLRQPNKVIIALVNGGALVDFRTKDGRTALHRAVEKNNLEALKTLLDLGASPNYKDGRNLTPLYYTIIHNADVQLSEMLLHDHASIGSADPQGWQELHQACKHGLVKHLDQLLYYGADIDVRNASGNTPLHVCAVNDQEECAKCLLRRGADVNALNYANQTPYQVAVIAGNLKLAEIINNHKPEHIVAFTEAPSYNPRRRVSTYHGVGCSLSATQSDSRLCSVSTQLSHQEICSRSTAMRSSATVPANQMAGASAEEKNHFGHVGTSGTSAGFGASPMRPPSPSPSNRSLPALSSDTLSTHSGSTFQDEVVLERLPSESSHYASSRTDHHQNQSISINQTPHVMTAGSTCVAQQNYVAQSPQQLSLGCGDRIEVLRVIDSVMLEGLNRDTGQTGLFPSICVRLIQDCEGSSYPTSGGPPGYLRDPNCFSYRSQKVKKHFSEPRTVILHKGKKGFGFVLRGAKDRKVFKGHEMNDNWPSLQYLDDVDKGGVADMVGLKKGDFLMEINGQDVSQASHETVVNIIRQSGDLVAMTVVSALASNEPQPNYRQCATLPSKLSKKAPAPPKRDPKTTLTLGAKSSHSSASAGAAQLAKGTEGAGMSKHGGTSAATSVHYDDERMCVSMMEKDTNDAKVASIRSRPSSRRMTGAELEEFFTRQSESNIKERQTQDGDKRKCATIARISRPTTRDGKCEEIKPASAEEEEALKALHKNFASVPDLNKENQSSKSRSASGDNLKDSAMDRDRDRERVSNGNDPNELVYSRSSKAYKKDDKQIYAETLPLGGKKTAAGAGPPPAHPPPPPPTQSLHQLHSLGAQAKTDYAGLSDVSSESSAAPGTVNSGGIMSSFRPGDSAKLYASPECIMSTVGYRHSPAMQSVSMADGHSQVISSRSQSVPPPKNRTIDSSAIYKMHVNAGTGNVSRGPCDDIKGAGGLDMEGDTPPLPPPPSDSLAHSHPHSHAQHPPPPPLSASHPHHQQHRSHQQPYIPDPDYNSSEEDENTPKQAPDNMVQDQMDVKRPQSIYSIGDMHDGTLVPHESKHELSVESPGELPLPPPPPLPVSAVTTSESGASPLQSTPTQVRPPLRSSSIQEQPLPKPPPPLGPLGPQTMAIPGQPQQHRQQALQGLQTDISEQTTISTSTTGLPPPPSSHPHQNVSVSSSTSVYSAVPPNMSSCSTQIQSKSQHPFNQSHYQSHNSSAATSGPGQSMNNANIANSTQSANSQMTANASGVHIKRQGDKLVLEQVVSGSQNNKEQASGPTQSMMRCSTATAGAMSSLSSMSTALNSMNSVGTSQAATATSTLPPATSHSGVGVGGRPMSHDDSSLIEKKLIEQRRAQVIQQHILAQQQQQQMQQQRPGTAGSGSGATSEELMKRLNQSYLQRGQSAEEMLNTSRQHQLTLQRQQQQQQQMAVNAQQQRRSASATRSGEANNNNSSNSQANNNLSQQQLYLLQQQHQQQQQQQRHQSTLPLTKHSTQILSAQQQAALHQQQIYQQHLQRQREQQLQQQMQQQMQHNPAAAAMYQSQQVGQATQNIPKKTLKIRLDQKVQATRRTQDRCSSLDRNLALQRSLDSAGDCSNLRRSIDESLQFIRMQVDSLGLASVNEMDVLSDVVPPPPEFNASHSHSTSHSQQGQGGQRGGQSACPPPPQFSDHIHHSSTSRTLPAHISSAHSHTQLTPQQAAAYQAALQQQRQLQQRRQLQQAAHSAGQHLLDSTHGRASPDLRTQQQLAQHLQQNQQQAAAVAAYEAYAKRLHNGCTTLPAGFTGGGTLRVLSSQQRHQQQQGWEPVSQQMESRQQFATLGGRGCSGQSQQQPQQTQQQSHQHAQHQTQQSQLQQQYQQYHLHKQQQAAQQAAQQQQGVLHLERHDLAGLRTVQREFRQKSLDQWTQRDVADWLESLFLQEYKPNFAGISGAKLLQMNQNDFIALGVKQVGHRVNMERSLKRYMK